MSRSSNNLNFDQFLINVCQLTQKDGVWPKDSWFRHSGDTKPQAKNAWPLCFFHASLSPRCVRSLFRVHKVLFVHFCNELSTHNQYR